MKQERALRNKNRRKSLRTGAVKKGDFEGAGKSAGAMVADAKKLKEDVEKGSKLKFMGD